MIRLTTKYANLMSLFLISSNEGRFPQYPIFVLTAAKVRVLFDTAKFFQRKIAVMDTICYFCTANVTPSLPQRSLFSIINISI